MTRTPENDAITKRQYDDPALRAAMEKHYPYWEWGAQCSEGDAFARGWIAASDSLPKPSTDIDDFVSEIESTPEGAKEVAEAREWLKAALPQWTTEPPTAPGHYWLRNLYGKGDVMMTRVNFNIPDRMSVVWEGGQRFHDELPPDIQWSGPIHPPGE